MFKKLKSGTDIRGIAAEGVVGENITLTDDVVCRITDAFALWISNRLGKLPTDIKISVGHDSRISAERIKKCVINTLVSRGFNVIDCALASTPSMFMTTLDLDCDAAIQITASHHPFNRNGLKFFTKQGGLEGKDIEKILSIASTDEVLSTSSGSVTEIDYMKQYSANLRKMIIDCVNSEDDREKPLKNYHIVVDAGNGAGGFYATEVLAPLGADISGSQFLEPDGMFPNHIPNPENVDAMNSARSAVLAAKADLGIVFDTDVDRAAVVDENGKEINKNRLIALASAIALENNEGGTIVTDSVTSDGLTDFIENILGGVHHRFKRGYKNVIDEAQRLNKDGINCPLAIETSGHAALRENYFLDDGAYLVTKIIIAMAKLGEKGCKIGDVLSQLSEPAETYENRFTITVEDFIAFGKNVLEEFLAFADTQKGWNIVKDNYEGVRVSVDKDFGDGWILLRMSLHDPAMPINIESNTVGGVDMILNVFRKFISTIDGIIYKL